MAHRNTDWKFILYGQSRQASETVTLTPIYVGVGAPIFFAVILVALEWFRFRVGRDFKRQILRHETPIEELSKSPISLQAFIQKKYSHEKLAKRNNRILRWIFLSKRVSFKFMAFLCAIKTPQLFKLAEIFKAVLVFYILTSGQGLPVTDYICTLSPLISPLFRVWSQFRAGVLIVVYCVPRAAVPAGDEQLVQLLE